MSVLEQQNEHSILIIEKLYALLLQHNVWTGEAVGLHINRRLSLNDISRELGLGSH
jgi:hypothetical protein